MIVPVILSGHWHAAVAVVAGDVSQAVHPFLQREGRSLLGNTLERLGGENSFAAPIVICTATTAFSYARNRASEHRAASDHPGARSRNTAPAVAVAALFAQRQSEDAILAVMPSDHVVADELGFVERIKRAAMIAATGRLVLFGIKPAEAHTGYGYIRQGAPLDADSGGFAVETFCEKPDRASAEKYLAAGGYFWNSGICLSARVLGELGTSNAHSQAARGAGKCHGGPGLPGWSLRPLSRPPTYRSTTR
jgi:mannose-1-phosphate guanylyltransferase/mannose-6-phosphate isomerase